MANVVHGYWGSQGMDDFEHRCWLGGSYNAGIDGQRVAICGFSHYSDEGDDPDLTNIVLTDVMNGARYRFFVSIAQAFGFEDAVSFWPRVLFFNFIPTSVGVSADRYSAGSADQIERGKARVLRLIDEHRPDKLFVFSRKAWDNFPLTVEEMRGEPLHGALKWGIYERQSGRKTVAIGLRHPQFARAEELRAAVTAGMAIVA
ncbi:MAG: hypothetical protein DI540_01055 [Sphingobium sp.]|nr:MAG: hypothetical protein DI540_01055 [Sphingobium sp.]